MNINLTGYLYPIGVVQNISLDSDLYASPFFSPKDLEEAKKQWESLGITWEDGEETFPLFVSSGEISPELEKRMQEAGLTPFDSLGQIPLNVLEGKKEGDNITLEYILPIKGEKITALLEITLRQKELGFKMSPVISPKILLKPFFRE